jgi:uncharacterized membrane protein
MTDAGLVSLFLFLHVGAAIIAFGPSFVFPIIGAMGAKDPTHANFGIRVSEAVQDRLVIPFALTMPVTGLLLIWFAHFDLTNRAFYWLDIAIVLYISAMVVSIGLQRPLVRKMVRLTTRPAGAAGGAPGAAPSAVSPGPGAAPAGPPPEIAQTAKKIQRNGMILSVLLVAIVFLMVVKPQF